MQQVRPFFQVTVAFNNDWKEFRLLFQPQQMLCNKVKSKFLPDDRGEEVKVVGLNKIIRETFLKRSLLECFDILTERSGGISLTLSGLILPERLEILRPVLDKTRKLTLACIIDPIPREMLFTDLLVPKRHLIVKYEVFHYGAQIIDDEFCELAASGTLELHASYPYVPISDTQLLTLVTRRDLKKLRIKVFLLPTLEGVRAAIQELLISQMECEFTFEGLPRDPDTIDRVFAKELGKEVIAISTTTYRRQNMRCTEYRYTNKERVVSATAIIDTDVSRLRIFANDKEIDEQEDVDVVEELEALSR